jgi:curved DNA-binding protein CbpA
MKTVAVTAEGLLQWLLHEGIVTEDHIIEYAKELEPLEPEPSNIIQFKDYTNAEAQFKEANEAYEVLKDADKKAAYDRYGHAAFEGGMGGGQGDFSSAFSDVFDYLFGNGNIDQWSTNIIQFKDYTNADL